jgi:SAM-dependent methyltransferase
MTLYEWVRLSLYPFLPAIEGIVRKTTKRLIVKNHRRKVSLLDIGGRKSPYTIGLPASVTILDLPRTNEVQQKLNLGFTADLLEKIRKQRSNIENIILQDMITCTLASDSFDGIICVEVIEHVEKDEEFVRQIYRVLKPGGWLILTSPNGDYIKNVPPHYNPDHRRHYRKQELWDLLSAHFEEVEIQFAVKTSKSYLRGLRQINYRNPLSTTSTMLSNFINMIQSKGQKAQAIRTAKLLAIARKKNGPV